MIKILELRKETLAKLGITPKIINLSGKGKLKPKAAVGV